MHSAEGPIELTEDLERIMEVSYYEGTILLDGAIVYEMNGIWYLPLYQMVEVLGLSIKISPELGVADGYIIEESRKIHLDVNKCELDVKDNKLKYECKKVVKFLEDIYVTSDFLELMFPLNLTINSLTSKIVIKALDEFPSYSKIKRGQKKVAKANTGEFNPGYPIVENNYDWLNGVFWDQVMRGGVATGASGKYNISHGLITAVSGEVLKMKGKYTMALDNSRISYSLFNLSRMDQEASMLGPLHASQFQIYNIFGFSETEIGSNGNLIGLSVSNNPLANSLNFSSQKFTGPLIAGWEVELYQNESLINRYTSDQNNENKENAGRYLFEDIPLVYGENKFKLIFYGPQGQKRIENQNYNIAQNVLSDKVGLLYKFSYGKNIYDKNNYYLSFEKNILHGVSASIGMQNVYLVNRSLMQDYRFLRINGFLYSISYQGTYTVNEATGGNAKKIILGFPVFGWRTRYEDISFSRYNSIAINRQITDFSTNHIVQRRMLSLNGVLPYFEQLSSDLIVNLDYDLLNSKRFVLTNRLNKMFPAFSLRNSFTRRTDIPIARSVDYIDLVTLSVTMFDINVQSNFQFNYSKKIANPEDQEPPKLESIRIVSSLGDRQKSILNINYGLNFTKDKNIHILGLGWLRSFKEFQFFVNGSFDTTKNVNINVGVNFSMAASLASNTVNFMRLNQADLGAAQLHVFNDKNSNLIFDGDDVGIPDIEIKYHQRSDKLITDSSGRVFIGAISPLAPGDFSIIASSINEMNLAPVQEGYRLRALGGKLSYLSMPIAVFAEISGVVEFEYEQGKFSPLKAAPVEIYNAKTNEFFKFSFTNSNGEFLIPKIPAGSYYVTIAKKFVQDRNKRVINDKILVEVNQDSDYITIEKIKVETFKWPVDEAGNIIDNNQKSEQNLIDEKENANNEKLKNTNVQIQMLPNKSSEEKKEEKKEEKSDYDINLDKLEEESKKEDKDKNDLSEKLYNPNVE